MFYIAFMEEGILYLYPKRLGPWVTSKGEAKRLFSLRSAQLLANEVLADGVEGVFIIAGDPDGVSREV